MTGIDCDRICESCGAKCTCHESPYYGCISWNDMTEEAKAEFFKQPPFTLKGKELYGQVGAKSA